MTEDAWGSVTLSKFSQREELDLIHRAIDRLTERGFTRFRSSAGASYVRVEGVRK